MSLYVISSAQKIIWRYERDEDVLTQLQSLRSQLDDMKRVLLLDLRSIRYLLPEDRRIISQYMEDIKSCFSLIDSVYLVDFRNFHRMCMLIKVNQLPHSHMIFKYEADAHDYLDERLLKQNFNHGSILLNEGN